MSDETRYIPDGPTIVHHVSESGTLVGAVLGGQYQIVEVIGEGGIGIVYRARQLTVNRDVAVKILKKELANDDLTVRRFENEATAIARLRHPNTLRLYDCQRTKEGDLYLVTELLSGSPLSVVLKKQGRLGIERSVRVLDETCRSLSEAHSVGIVHRDLKPANIFIDHVGSEDIVKVLDFGIAKILQSSAITRAGIVPGTPHYMAPEHATAQRVDHRADIFSLGVILYQMLTGRVPFDGPSPMDILKKVVTDPAPPFASVLPGAAMPEELERLVFWMLEKSAEARPSSVDEVRRYLLGILAAVAPVRPLDGSPVREGSGTRAVVHAFTPTPARTTTPRADTVPSIARPPAPKPSRLLAWGIGGLGLGLGLAIGYAGGHREDVIPIATVPLEDLPAKPAPPHAPITLVTVPAGAAVYSNGTEVGTTPIELTFDGARTYRVVAHDGRASTVELEAARDAGKTIQVRLVEPGGKPGRPN